MTALPFVAREIAGLGYSAIERDYVFADVFAASIPDRVVPLAAFTHSPPSYRNAALAVVEAQQNTGIDLDSYRALGAPLLFVLEGDNVTVWQIHPSGRPTIYREAGIAQLHELFTENHAIWRPQRIKSAKLFGSLDTAYQLDFVDLGLLPAIEGEIHIKLDRLLNETLAEAVRLRVLRAGEPADDRLVFRTVFRLLAAKVLQDRGHEITYLWDTADIDTVLHGIAEYYTLPTLPGEFTSFKETVFESAWERLARGINFRNISSGDLAFVYEHTLVTDETRKHFGVHSTPRPVAEYIVNNLKLWMKDTPSIRVYEPFTGAGVFLVAALRRLNDCLPGEMGPRQRHEFLVKRLYGDEIEPFAAEVARLSLILADYPNENGWDIAIRDAFKNNVLVERAKKARVVLCNPPFETFAPQRRGEYRVASARSPRKAVAALEAILDIKPEAIGFVLPEPFIEGPHYKPQRDRVERLYEAIELVKLPDRIFKASVIRSSLLIAQEPRRASKLTLLRSTEVKARDRERFSKSGEVSDTREAVRQFANPTGRLWIDELEEVWEALADLPTFGSIAEVHRGIEWKDDQSGAVQSEPAPGFRPGVHSSGAVHAFRLDPPRFLDCRPARLRGRAINLRWSAPKILANAARVSRGPWCMAAAIDRTGLVASQQLFGVWPLSGQGGLSLEALGALLNGPVGVAYLSTHSPPDRLRVGTVKSIPVPVMVPREVDELVQRYVATISESAGPFRDAIAARANRQLHQIDAAILATYDLPPRLERRILEYFRGEQRPTVHPWTHWFPDGFTPFIPLHRFISDEYVTATSGWPLRIFKPLPSNEARALREYID